MTNRHLTQVAAAFAVLLGVFALARQAEAFNLLTEQPGNYESGGCTWNTNVPDYSYPIRNGAAALNWNTTFWTGSQAWPQDFMDPGDLADNYDTVVFLGHGNTGQNFYSTPHNSLCSAGATQGNYYCAWGDLSCSNTQLAGGSTGGKASSVVMMACCYMNFSSAQDLILQHHQEKQLMGFGGEAELDAGMVNNYWNATAGTSNIDAWLNNMEDRPGWFTGDNTTVVMSRGHSSNELNWNQLYCGLKRQNCVDGGAGGGYWALNWHWHGCGGCAACPFGNY